MSALGENMKWPRAGWRGWEGLLRHRPGLPGATLVVASREPTLACPSPAQPQEVGPLRKRSTNAELNFLLWSAGTPPRQSKFAFGHWRHAEKGKGRLAIFVGIFSQGVALGSPDSRGVPAPWGEPWEHWTL
ncbi:hypothetical protein B0T18DRAFT_390486 [Schizothecium vesticola]|uniref:Uncharacterized protein n=1 Tax=Schizothecium vesticola TaxID=314040 RepID=A0AA40EUY3_9PEZI|nr:hypothetical protein B0T18DRAFT_390486 [Schizothecium vesticola]